MKFFENAELFLPRYQVYRVRRIILWSEEIGGFRGWCYMREGRIDMTAIEWLREWGVLSQIDQPSFVGPNRREIPVNVPTHVNLIMIWLRNEILFWPFSFLLKSEKGYRIVDSGHVAGGSPVRFANRWGMQVRMTGGDERHYWVEAEEVESIEEL